MGIQDRDYYWENRDRREAKRKTSRKNNPNSTIEDMNVPTSGRRNIKKCFRFPSRNVKKYNIDGWPGDVPIRLIRLTPAVFFLLGFLTALIGMIIIFSINHDLAYNFLAYLISLS
ncbi:MULTISPECIES: hypothetical protein [Halomonadaceae]|uniref:hypothetical protein n=1 Tax=Halomonadaceae TaxID=28256 RepID=UPI00159A1ECB|nr:MULTISPECIES: hypothetical protein [Halomonas]QJQ96270.1 hypothetical protein HIO72_14010 [Halomonas sp. PA5]